VTLAPKGRRLVKQPVHRGVRRCTLFIERKEARGRGRAAVSEGKLWPRGGGRRRSEEELWGGVTRYWNSSSTLRDGYWRCWSGAVDASRTRALYIYIYVCVCIYIYIYLSLLPGELPLLARSLSVCRRRPFSWPFDLWPLQVTRCSQWPQINLLSRSSTESHWDLVIQFMLLKSPTRDMWKVNSTSSFIYIYYVCIFYMFIT